MNKTIPILNLARKCTTIFFNVVPFLALKKSALLIKIQFLTTRKKNSPETQTPSISVYNFCSR